MSILNKVVFNTRYWRKKCSLPRNYRKGIIIFLVVSSGALIFLLVVHVFRPVGFICLATNATLKDLNYNAFLHGKLCKHNFTESVLNTKRKLDLGGDDVLIYLHIQKTGGATFGRHLVHNLDIDFPCKCVPDVKKCDCLTRNKKHWLFSRHATGWMCGLHADWTELTDCVDEWFKHNDLKSRKHRIYHYITFLRNPVNRFLSEWQHVQRGATWKAARLHCNGRDASLEEVPFCFKGVDWSGVSLNDFLSCRHNLACDRMTRMLANLSKVNCYNHTGLNKEQVRETLVKSAKENLLECAFFGIVEEQRKTQFLFENTIGIRFIRDFKQKNKTHASRLEISNEMMKQVVEKNRLDIELYQYAKDLFLQRVAFTEKMMGYTVDEYFSNVRNAGKGNFGGNVNIDDYEEEYDNDEDLQEFVNFYQSKRAGFDMLVKSNDTFRRSVVI